MIPAIPSEVVVPMAGWKVSQSNADPTVVEPLTGVPWNLLVVLLAATIGAAVGSLAAYLIGLWGGRPLLDRYGRYLGISAEHLATAERWFDRWGTWAVLLGRFVPVVRALVSYPAGISRMRLGRFLLFSTIGSIPWNAALLYAGFLVGEQYENIARAAKPYEYAVIAVFGVALVALVAWWIVRRRRRAAATPEPG
ncbi:MAG: DedA family protein [Chloroflexota bacterium]|nr:DedA family protein [Chloroflexota bacterium]